jgi:hypothetical protein
MLTFLERTLLDELREAYSIFEDYHYKCDLEVIDLFRTDDNSEVEYCRTFDEASPVLDYQHNKLRAWSKIIEKYMKEQN